MTISSCAAILSVLLDLFVGARYCTKLIRRQAHPRIATWLIFEIGVLMSLATYFASHNHSALKAVLNLTDAAVVTLILALLFLHERIRRTTFTRNEQLSLAISCITLIAWILTRAAWVGFVGFQVVMSVAYIPTLESVWKWRPGPAPEPAETWSINAIAAFMGFVVDITGKRHDFLAMLYPLRALILCAVVVVLIQRWKHKSLQARR